MEKSRRFIYAVAKDRKILMKRFNINASSVSDALNFKGRSQLQREVRSFAVNHLGCIPMNVL